MTGVEYEKLQEWQRRGPGRRVDVTLDYRSWSQEKLVERIAVFDGESGLYGADIAPEEIQRLDEVLKEKAAKAARDAITANYAILLRCNGSGAQDIKSSLASGID